MRAILSRKRWSSHWLVVASLYFWLPSQVVWAANGAVAVPESYHLTILTEPGEAKVEVLNLDTPYQHNMSVAKGRYYISVSAPGFETEKGFVDVIDHDWKGRVTLHPLLSPVTPNLDEEWRKVEAEKLRLERLRQELAQEKMQLEKSKKAVTSSGMAATNPVPVRPSVVQSADIMPTPAASPANAMATPAAPPADDVVIPDVSPVIQDEEVVAPSPPLVNRRSVPPTDKIAAPVASPPTRGESPSVEGLTVPVVLPADKQTLVDGSVAPLLDAVRVYMERPIVAGRRPSPAESQAVLLKLQQAEKLEPNNAAVKRAMQLYSVRYIVFAGLSKVRAASDKVADKIRALGLPVYIQTLRHFEGGPRTQVCVGFFASRDEAAAVMKRLKEELHLPDLFMSVHKR